MKSINPRRNLVPFLWIFSLSIFLFNCKRNSPNPTPLPPIKMDTSGTILSLLNGNTSFPNMAFAVSLAHMSIPDYVNTVKREANYVTFENELKNGSIMNPNGSFNFTNADALYSICSQNGLNVFGHNLCWYQQQNASYFYKVIKALNKPATGGGSANLLSYGDFEQGSGNSPTGSTTFTGWNNIVGGSSVGTFLPVVDQSDGGSRAMQVTVTQAGANSYDLQSIGPKINVISGNYYLVTVHINSQSTGAIQLVLQNSSYVNTQISTSPGWNTYYWTVKIGESNPIFRLNFPTSGVYTFDNISIIPSNNLISGGDFEQGSGNSPTGNTTFTGWNNIIGGTSSGSFLPVTDQNDGGSRAMQVSVTMPGANAYDMQSIGPQFNATPGILYLVSVNINSASAGSVQLVLQNSGYVNTTLQTYPGWNTYYWPVVIQEANPIFRLNFPTKGVYTFDNISIVNPAVGPPATPAIIATPTMISAQVDSLLKNNILTTVGHYFGKIKAWDVVNEPMADGTGALRTKSNFKISDSSSQFLWADYLGRNFTLKAFQYAKAADPKALLFINEYNLEDGSPKLDSLIAYVSQQNAAGAKIDGIGTQMHISLRTLNKNIDNMFLKLAKTGLKIRISEMDISVNLNKNPTFQPDSNTLAFQGNLYQYVVKSYIKNVPAAQRFGVTVWGLRDPESYLNQPGNPEFPLLFDKNYKKKPDYHSILGALKGQ